MLKIEKIKSHDLFNKIFIFILFNIEKKKEIQI